mgnify:FL=1
MRIVEINENTEVCKNCGGRCCKKSGCDYWPSDLPDKTYKGILKFLENGKVSIVAMMNFKRINGKLCNFPFLYLRGRNTGRDVVDLLSMKTPCSNLTEHGCSYTYEERPSGGKNLTPSKEGLCYPKEDNLQKVLEWSPYQKQLEKIVKRYTGLSIDNKIKEDVVTLLTDIKEENFKNVSELEIIDVERMLPMLIECYKEQAEQVLNNSNKLLVKNNR